MPQKTIYLKDSAVSLWEQAQQQLGESMSDIVETCLRQRLGQRQRIIVSDGYRKQEKEFDGTWILQHIRTIEKSVPEVYSVALTKGGRYLLYTEIPEDEESRFKVYESIDEIEADGLMPRLVSQLRRLEKKKVEYLDV